MEASVTVGETTFKTQVVVGTEGERGIDITKLRESTGLVTLDPAFVNTASAKSAITYIDGDQGILRYRGIPIEELAEKSTFIETAYLLIYGHLPRAQELERFSRMLTRHSMLHEDMKHFFDGYPSTAHPMAVLSAMICSLSSYYPDALDVNRTDIIDLTVIRLISKVRTLAAYTYKKSVGQPFVYPNNSLEYCENFLYMMFSVPAEPYEVDPEIARILNQLLILHADHEQNCSTSTVRLVGSSKVNLFAAAAAGVCALWGPLHGGANQEVIEMLETIRDRGGDVRTYVEKAKNKAEGFKLMGFGHRVYRNFDPRAKIVKNACEKVLSKLGKQDELLDIALRLEDAALTDDYFKERKLYPNIDFYSGLIYRALGIPTNMFTVMFALGRLPGWIAHWKETLEDSTTKIGRPRQIYVGQGETAYFPIEAR